MCSTRISVQIDCSPRSKLANHAGIFSKIDICPMLTLFWQVKQSQQLDLRPKNRGRSVQMRIDQINWAERTCFVLFSMFQPENCSCPINPCWKNRCCCVQIKAYRRPGWWITWFRYPSAGNLYQALQSWNKARSLQRWHHDSKRAMQALLQCVEHTRSRWSTSSSWERYFSATGLETDACITCW